MCKGVRIRPYNEQIIPTHFFQKVHHCTMFICVRVDMYCLSNILQNTEVQVIRVQLNYGNSGDITTAAF